MIDEEIDKDRLGKIVALAKNGIGGEKQNALRIVKQLCKKFNLDFDDVMENIQIKEFRMKYRTLEEKEVANYCIYRYAMLSYEDGTWYNSYSKEVIFKTTYDKYIETLNAYSVLKNLYKKEKERATKAIILAFRQKHELYYMPTESEWKKIKKENKGKKKTPEQIAEDEALERMATHMAYGMENAEIHKQLK